MLRDDIFICIDLETTGLSPMLNKIVEIGAVKFSSGEGVIEIYSQLVNPGIHIPPSITTINGINNKMVKNAPPIEDVMDNFISFIKEYPCVAHNANFDVSFLAFNMNKLNIIPPKNEYYDTLSISRKIFPEIKKYSLSYLKEYFEIKTEVSHRSIPDCLATINIFNRCLEKSRLLTKSINDLKNIAKPISYTFDDEKSYKKYEAFINKIQKSIELQNNIYIHYLNRKGELTKREISPYSIFHFHDQLYLKGFCLLRSEERNFRVDRIKEVQITEHEFVY